MKDINEILEQKEADLNRVRRELDSLKVVASLLSDDTTDEPTKKPTSAEKPPLNDDAEATGTDSLFSSISSMRSNFWPRR